MTVVAFSGLWLLIEADDDWGDMRPVPDGIVVC